MSPLDASIEDLQHVTLCSAYKQLDRPLVRNLFLDLCRLKLKGYGHKISDHFVPLDTWDFIGVHEIACLKRENQLIPLMSYKSCRLDTSIFHSARFPGYNCASFETQPRHYKAAKKYIEQSLLENKKISYVGSFTIHPEVSRNRKLKARLYQIYMAQTLWHLLDQKLDRLLALAMLQFNTGTTFQKIGLSKLTDEDGEMGSFPSEMLFGQTAEFWKMDSSDISQEVKDLCEELQPYWDARLTIGHPRQTPDTVKNDLGEFNLKDVGTPP